ncbi:hypothetical protein EUGRSUZ_B01093 [Eucalyptus grandis]|uniref:Uncharacterized protein n=2 Tax=Eucalyptus grandis TaxID=71139 RepID=A0ACC3LPK5_EUCGR|nr:hypothetical protein EUGRSUZ_B01093 [Eucalyptus grandis]
MGHRGRSSYRGCVTTSGLLALQIGGGRGGAGASGCGCCRGAQICRRQTPERRDRDSGGRRAGRWRSARGFDGQIGDGVTRSAGNE